MTDVQYARNKRSRLLAMRSAVETIYSVRFFVRYYKAANIVQIQVAVYIILQYGPSEYMYI